MSEILYDQVNNVLFLFSGEFELDTEKKVMTLYVYGKNRKSIKLIDAKNLTHIGWL